MATTNGTSTTDWSISNDIYGIVEAVDNLKKRFVEDEDETTLALGIFGFLGDVEAKKIQTAVVTVGELGNEMFPQRAKLDKNIVAHALNCNVDHLNAVPAEMTITMMVYEDEIDKYMQDDKFTFDSNCPMYIEKYEYHLDYDLQLKRYRNSDSDKWMYTATYLGMDSDPNPISDLTNPYVDQPYTINYNGYTSIIIRVTVRQVIPQIVEDKLVTDSIIDNKSYVFNYDNQLADFVVYITEKGITKRLIPIPYGGNVESGVTDYCWYMFINDGTIRISFDSTSYLPGINANINIKVYTTSGSVANFKSKVASDINEEGYYIEYNVASYKYKTIQVYVRPVTDSTGGQDKKTIEELQRLIPKMSMSRGFITTETDLNNYFNLISTKDNLLKLQKKVDNQLQRIWYCYMLLKDDDNNVIPTNTLPVKIDIHEDLAIIDDDTCIIPAGAVFKYDRELGYARIIGDGGVPTPYTDEYFANDGVYYYKNIYDIVIYKNPLVCSYRMTLCDKSGYFEYLYMNSNMFMGFIMNTYNFRRKLLTEKFTYTLRFGMEQSVQDEDYELYKIIYNDQGEVEEIINNMKVFLVLYEGDQPLRYVECEVESVDPDSKLFNWKATLTTDSTYDMDGKMKLTNVHEIYSGALNPGYFEDSFPANVMIFAKFDEDYGISDDYANIIPPRTVAGYSLVNVYGIQTGIELANNFSNVMNTRIREALSEDKTNGFYNISGIPLVGYHFFINEDNVSFFIHKLLEKKAYIDNGLKVVENNMDIDFKYYNTYGYSETYTIGDIGHGIVSLGDIDITMNFRVKLTNSNDTATRDAIIQFIKNSVEDVNELGDLHIPNLIHDIKEYFGDAIVYIEFRYFNENPLGINHIELRDVIDPHTVPEFISVRNRWNADHSALEPCIDLEVVV